MTVFQMLEKVQKHFPKVGLTEFLIDLNKAYKYFCHETRLLKRIDSWTPEENVISFTLTDVFSDIDGVTRIDTLSNDKFVSTEDTLQYNIESGVIRFFDYKGNQINSITGGDEVKFYYYAVPDDLTSNTDEPEIDSQFHDALVSKVLADYYSSTQTVVAIKADGTQILGKEWQSADKFELKYKQLEIAGKRKANEL